MKKVTFLLVLIISSQLKAQRTEDYNVAIFLYDGVELLDFSGPGEVFAVSEGFNVYTVSVDGKEILSQGFVSVTPEFSIDNALTPDIIVFPGGNISASVQDSRVINWAKESAKRNVVQMSVCTGAMILAEAGLLDSLKVTTWYGAIDRLKNLIPNSTVLENTRFIDSGHIITTAGVSAGIDGALHMVSRIKGRDVANSTAKYMEYDKWNPYDGLIDHENDFTSLIESPNHDQNPFLKTVKDFGKPPFYEGEMKNLAIDLMEKQEWTKAANILELITEFYPNSVASYELLRKVYEMQGRFVPISEKEFINLLLEGKIGDALEAFQKAQSEYSGWKMFRESYLNYAGKQYLEKQRIDKAIILFTLNSKVYPNSADVFINLGEAHLKSGELDTAQANFNKALELEPFNESALTAIRKLNKDLNKKENN